MMDWKETIGKLAPTVASALLGPLGGVAVSAIGSAIGLDSASQDTIKKAIEGAQLTPEQISKIQALELQYQNDEKERGFRYSELAFKDRDSARQANVSGGTQKMLFALSLVLLIISIGSEVWVLFHGYPKEVPEIVVGRVLGLLDAVAMMVLTYWYGTTNGSQIKTDALANSAPVKS